MTRHLFGRDFDHHLINSLLKLEAGGIPSLTRFRNTLHSVTVARLRYCGVKRIKDDGGAVSG